MYLLTSYKCLRITINMSLLTVAFWILIITDFNHNYNKASFMYLQYCIDINTYTTLYGENFSKRVKWFTY